MAAGAGGENREAATSPHGIGERSHERDRAFQALTGPDRDRRASTTSSAADSRATGCTWSGRSRSGQDDPGHAVPARRGAARASRASTPPCRRPRRSCATSPAPTAGRSTASRSATCRPPRRASRPTPSTPCSTPRRWSSPRPPAPCSTWSSGSQPLRVVFDSLSEMRLLARDSLRYRRQILALKQYFTGRRCTVLLLDYGTQPGEFQLESLAHGVLSAGAARARATAAQRRRLRGAEGPRHPVPRAATTTTSSAPAGWRSSRAWWPRSITASVRARDGLERPRRSWTRCSAAASTAAPA